MKGSEVHHTPCFFEHDFSCMASMGTYMICFMLPTTCSAPLCFVSSLCSLRIARVCSPPILPPLLSALALTVCLASFFHLFNSLSVSHVTFVIDEPTSTSCSPVSRLHCVRSSEAPPENKLPRTRSAPRAVLCAGLLNKVSGICVASSPELLRKSQP